MLAQLAEFSDALGGHLLLWFSVFWVGTSIFWLGMLVDCLTRKRLPGNEKLIWVVVLLCTHLVGAALYLILVRTRNAGENLPPGEP